MAFKDSSSCGMPSACAGTCPSVRKALLRVRPRAWSSAGGPEELLCGQWAASAPPVGTLACFLSFPFNQPLCLSCQQVVVFDICDKINHRLLKFCLYTLRCEPITKELSFFTNECVFEDWGGGGGQTLNRPSIFPALNTLNSLVSNKSCWYCDQLGLL